MKRLIATTLTLSLATLALSHAPTAQAQDSPTPKAGQGTIVTPTPRQLELNKKAVKAFDAGRYDQAIQYFKDSLTIQNINIIHLNLGRAYYRNKQCLKAEQSYIRAIDAKTPGVKSPSTAQMDKAVKRYMVELKNSCPGYLTVTCSTGKMSIYINNEGPKPCPGKQQQFEPGQYTIYGEVDGQKTNPVTINIKRLQQSTVQLDLKIIKKITPAEKIVTKPVETTTTPPVTVIPQPKPKDTEGTSSIGTAVTFVSLGAAMVLGSMYWDTCGFNYFSQSNLSADRKKYTEAEFKDKTGWCHGAVDGKFGGTEAGTGLLYVFGTISLIYGVTRF